VDAVATGTAIRIEFRNAGTAAGVFQVRSADPAQAPRSYTLAGGTHLADDWTATSGYDLSVHGPNGFFRHFAASTAHTGLELRMRYDERRNEVVLAAHNHSDRRIGLTVADRYSGHDRRLSVDRGDTTTRQWSLARTRGWYGLVVTVARGQALPVRVRGPRRERTRLDQRPCDGRATLTSWSPDGPTPRLSPIVRRRDTSA
jgi:phospholipase C